MLRRVCLYQKSERAFIFNSHQLLSLSLLDVNPGKLVHTSDYN